ncbi:hypothetical protein FNU76_23410 [Chitinimonas arctica]|uniref:SHOCT domain-containing protein n=1 Tax=Chitinimonas arctica TaxID=2594795 RepID=A0A516SLZ7_9NEIS|nr:hypothetical protein [Chitinimonas arctica]QDQ29058.1 hypothetical protein FNU76_23410 [Chitinimonas arctica]
MQHALSSRLGQLGIGLLMTVSAMAYDSSKPWSETDDYVRLDAVNAANQHPVTFSVEQLQSLLTRFYKKEAEKEPAPYFSEDEGKRLANWLVPLFAKATKGDDVLFGTSYRPGNMFFVPRSLNAGRFFVENGRLHLLMGMCAEPFDISYQRSYAGGRALNHGSRIKPVNGAGCELLAGNGVERVNNRPDWLSMDISAALASKPVTTFAPAAAPTTFQPAATPGVPPAAAPAPRPPASAAAPAPTSPAVAAPISKIEERLLLLKRLKDTGLINAAEYEQKRAAILKEL